MILLQIVIEVLVATTNLSNDVKVVLLFIQMDLIYTNKEKPIFDMNDRNCNFNLLDHIY